jgi:uncharacterized protein YecE (DUF72 family)
MIRVGIGGWTYEPWRGAFYPPGLPHVRELEYAAAHVTAIEINGTYYRLQSPASFAKWAKAVPQGFMFTLKSSRYCTNRANLGEAGEAAERFVRQGIVELGAKLGPILWQLMPTKRFDPDEIAAFLKLLPASEAGVTLRHAIEPRHESFRDPAFAALCREAGIAIVFADSDEHPQFDEATAGFRYARLQRAREDEPDGYAPAALDAWAARAREWSAEGDVFVFMINGAKVRAPAAAMALIDRLGGRPD